MAGPAALQTVQDLLALDAEQLAEEQAGKIAALCEFDGRFTLAVVVASKGMWTDRLATEVQHRTTASRRDGHGIVMLWTGDKIDAAVVRRESTAESVRTMWTSLHGPAVTLRAVLAREGLAYALASNPFGPATAEVDACLAEAISVLGDTSTLGDIVGVLYGDSATTMLGWTPLGIGEYHGFRWAIARAAELLVRVGARDALRTGRML
ncbi:MAG: hypothetical protein ABI969_14905 [bacterium]